MDEFPAGALRVALSLYIWIKFRLAVVRIKELLLYAVAVEVGAGTSLGFLGKYPYIYNHCYSFLSSLYNVLCDGDVDLL
jgi:hypothetical protein